MGYLIAILLTLALLICNLIYCGQRIIADLRYSRSGAAIWGSLALGGALMALLLMIWATAASLAQF